MAGTALELVAAGEEDGPKHTLSRIFDNQATDRDIYAGEVEPMLSHLISGNNISVITAGYEKSGRVGSNAC